MNIQQVDPHPGRCRNHRSYPAPYGIPLSVRCNGAEGTEHVCWFTEPVRPPAEASQMASYTHTVKAPVPWVVPERK